MKGLSLGRSMDNISIIMETKVKWRDTGAESE